MYKYFILFLTIFLLLPGCAKRGHIVSIKNEGIYHQVEEGQTLWKISKAYNLDIAAIAQANKLRNPSEISTGQLIFIPGKTDKKTISQNTVCKISPQGFIWPLEGRVISYYGMKANGVTSKGINIAAQNGLSVKASKDGKISFADEKVKGKGKVIIIDHFNGYFTLYAHNSELLVEPGEMVKQGQIIAKAGATGRAQAPQLYFEIRKGHSAKDPFYYLP